MFRLAGYRGQHSDQHEYTWGLTGDGITGDAESLVAIKDICGFDAYKPSCDIPGKFKSSTLQSAKNGITLSILAWSETYSSCASCQFFQDFIDLKDHIFREETMRKEF